MIDIKSIFVGVGAAVLGLAIGALVMWGIQRVKVSDALREASNAKLEKANMVDALNASLEREEKYKVTLEDTLIVVQLLKQYQSIDNETKREIESIKDSYDGDKPSKESIERFRALLVKINEKNTGVVVPEEFPSTGSTTDIVAIASSLEDMSDELFLEVMVVFFGEE